jgi:hypothetical protein
VGRCVDVVRRSDPTCLNRPSTPSRIRTDDLRIKSPQLWPLSYRGLLGVPLPIPDVTQY